MRFALTLLFLTLLLPALQAVAEGDDALPGEFGGCSPPESPAIPDGEKVNADEIKQTVSLVKAYLKQGENYLACLTEVENSWGEEATRDQRKELIHNHNAMVDAMQAAAERFNVELAKYRAQEQ
jgi:hypothetical protein